MPKSYPTPIPAEITSATESSDQVQEVKETLAEAPPIREEAAQELPKIEKIKEVAESKPTVQKQQKKLSLNTKKTKSKKTTVKYHPDLHELQATKSRIEALKR